MDQKEERIDREQSADEAKAVGDACAFGLLSGDAIVSIRRKVDGLNELEICTDKHALHVRARLEYTTFGLVPVLDWNIRKSI
jgi:hypothetical protein